MTISPFLKLHFSLFSASKKITLLPFYGGAKGQSLQITEYSDGRIETAIVKNPEIPVENTNITVNTSELENPVLPSIYELSDLGSNIRKIQDTALTVVKLQEKAKEKGALNEAEEALYKQSMVILNRTAQNLANLQNEMHPLDLESREGLSSWFERKSSSSKDKNKKKEEDKRKKEEEKRKKEEEEKKKKEEEKRKKDEEKKKKEEQEKKKKDEEKKKKEEENKRLEEEMEKKKQEEEKEREKEEEKEKEGEKEEDDGVEITPPDEDASVAEAKPVGLAVAGIKN